MVNSVAADAELKSSFPCRESCIDALADAVLCGQTGTGPVLVHGLPSTGKTAIVRAALAAWGVRHAYVDCVACPAPRALLSSVVSQLKGGPRLRTEQFGPGTDCDTLAEFLLLLPSLFRGRGAGAPGAWVVLDNAQRLAGSDLLTGLARAGGAADVPLSLLMLGRQPWSGAGFATPTHVLPQPCQLEWPAYTADQIIKIIEHRRIVSSGKAATSGEMAMLRGFLTAFVPSYTRASGDLLEAEAAVAALFPLYRAPLDGGKVLHPAQLHARIQPDVQRVVAERSAVAAAGVGGESGAGAGTRPPGLETQPLPFHLPFVSKYLILAAYLASRNKPTADRAVFDPGFRKRARRGAQAHDRMVEAAQEAALRGPHPFPLERLLHIFYALYTAHEQERGDEAAEGTGAPAGPLQPGYPPEMMQADVLMALSSLVTLRMLSMAGGDVLDGGALYRCAVEESVARAVAANLRVQLSDYLKLA